MNNFKKMVATITLMVVMTFTATFAHAGLLVSDRSINNTNTVPAVCDVKAGGPDNGLLVSDLIEGIIVFGLTSGGIIVFGKTTPTACTK